MRTAQPAYETIQEVVDGRPPALIHPRWRDEMPWLVQGTSTRGSSPHPFDLGYFSDASPEGRLDAHWRRLLDAVGLPGAFLARQVHGAEVRHHTRAPQGVNRDDVCDGHVTAEAGVLLAVTVADCVPVFLVAPGERAVGVLHAGWRGAAAGVLERGVELLASSCRARRGGVLLHLGPSICGACYEVGPEVFAALGEPVPDGPRPIDLRGVLVGKARAAGVAAISVSEHCTRCTGSGLFSHRAGDGERQVGFIGIRS